MVIMKASVWSFVKCLSLSAVLGLGLILPGELSQHRHRQPEGQLHRSQLLLRSSLMVTQKVEAVYDPDTLSSSLTIQRRELLRQSEAEDVT